MSYKTLSKKEKAILAIAKKGRFGDSELRKVNGEMSHVNKKEAALIDKYGQKAELLVKSVGSGTINPDTGLREYGLWSQLGTLWDRTLGNQGIGGAIFGWQEGQDFDAAAKNIANNSFSTTLSSAKKDLGAGGSIMKKKGDELSALQFEGAQQSEQVAETARNMASQQGFQGASASQQTMNQQIKDLAVQGKMQSKSKIDEALGEHKNVVDSLNQAKNQALSDYLSTTEENFGGSTQLDDLNAYIWEMQAGGAGSAKTYVNTVD